MMQGFTRRRSGRVRSLHVSRPAAVAAVLGLVLLGTPSSAAPEIPEAGACPVVAGAQGLQLMASASDNLFLSAPAGAGVPVAQSCVDIRIATSSGYASAPYPGGTVLSLVGSRVKFPGYASSQYPTAPESKDGGPGYAMSSTSGEHSSKATASAGLVGEQSQAAATAVSAESVVDPGTGEATATATSDTEPLAINDVLELGRIRSSAVAATADGGKLRRDSTLQVGRTTVAGQEVQISPDGVEAVDQTVGLPDVDPSEVLAQAGIEVRFVSEEKTSHGVIAAGIEIIARQTAPDSGAEYVVRYMLGRSFASARSVEPGAAPPGPVPLPPVADDTPAGTGGAASSGTAPPASASASGSIPGTSMPVTGVAPGAAPPQPAEAALQQVSSPIDIGASSLYLVLAFCGLVLFASATLLRLLGVRTR